MFEAAFKALSQMLSPPFRPVLMKSIGLALVMIVLIGIGLNRLFAWLAESGAAWAEAGTGLHTPWQILVWMLSIAATLGIVTGAVFLMPAVTAFVGSFFVDEIADEVERKHYPADPPGRALPLWRAADRRRQDRAAGDPGLSGARCRSCCSRGSASSSCSSPTAYLLGREYFELAAMRFRPPEEAKAMRRADRSHGLPRRPVDRAVRVDPDRQSGDAAVRHGADGAHAQAAVGRSVELIEPKRRLTEPSSRTR